MQNNFSYRAELRRVGDAISSCSSYTNVGVKFCDSEYIILFREVDLIFYLLALLKVVM